MHKRAVAPLPLALVLLAPACLSPSGGESASATESTGESTGMTEPTGSSEPVPTTGSTGAPAGCPAGCAADEACVGDACEAVGRAEIEAGCHPLGDPAGRGQCVYPWPSNFYTTPEASEATGLRVALPGDLLPKSTTGMAFPIDELVNGQPGFTPNAQIRFVSAAPIDAALLPPIDDIARSLADDAPIVLVQASTGERWPYFAEVDATAQPGEPQTIFIRPMRRLAFGERYVVAVRGLGEPTALFRALRDELPTDLPQLEQERGRYAEIFAALESAGVARASLQLAWDFTTNTEEVLQRDFEAIAPQIAAAAQAGNLGYSIDEISENPGEDVPLVIRGKFTVPSCLQGNSGPGTTFARGPDGLPDCSGTAEAPMWIAVPKSVYESKVSVPVAVYGHGLLGNGEEAVYVADKGGGLIMIGTDFWGMSTEDIPTIATVIGANFAGGRTLSDRLLQSAVNFTTLAYLAQGDLASEPALQGLLDPSEVYYIGGSQGGIMGGTVTAMAPNVARGVLVVGASNYSLMVWRSTSFADVNGLWEATQPSVQNREFLFSLYQAVFDYADPTTYRKQIDAAGDRLLLVESIGDTQVPNIASEAMARTFEMSLVVPSVTPVWAVPDAPPAFEGSALLQVDTKLGPLPPTQNLPADGDNGAHGAAVDDPAVQEIVSLFLRKGLVDNACSGACDPG